MVIVSTLFNIFKNQCSCEHKIDNLIKKHQNVITELETRNSMVIQNVNNENTRLLRVLEAIAEYIVVKKY